MQKIKKHHFMIDKGVLEKICRYANLKKSETILEIGAGTGNLTEFLTDRCGFVYAIEKDRNFYNTLKEKFSYLENIEIINADVLRIDLPKFDKVVSNLPYGISRRITERLLRERFQLGILVYQREFAQKLLAKPGTRDYRYISALMQSCADVEILDGIPPEAFDPKPMVFSAIVRVKPRIVAEQHYIDFLHSLFNQRNKKIENLIKLRGELPENLQKRRAFELKPEELREIYSNLYFNLS
ncbi:MAG TPA: ribosomal RNA small subunit methyltransferase A [Candidatus Altiarchaeales archaeon]|nr:ribosomal RNA small subunit methyltransferase A [Candidatus Altiarchaeales archaeon]